VLPAAAMTSLSTRMKSRSKLGEVIPDGGMMHACVTPPLLILPKTRGSSPDLFPLRAKYLRQPYPLIILKTATSPVLTDFSPLLREHAAQIR
jgi:hypothetical protein